MQKRTIKTVENRILDFLKVYRRMPTYAEMLTVLGVRSKRVVHFWVKKLIEKGVLEKDPGGYLRPAHQGFALPLVGEIQAGFPSLVEEELRDLISIEEGQTNHPGSRQPELFSHNAPGGTADRRRDYGRYPEISFVI